MTEDQWEYVAAIQHRQDGKHSPVPALGRYRGGRHIRLGRKILMTIIVGDKMGLVEPVPRRAQIFKQAQKGMEMSL